MPWVRFGDNAATYPKLLQIRGYPGADARAVNEVRGWLFACATQSGGHLTDYAIDYGTAELFGGTRTKKLIGWCVRAGLLTEHTAADGSVFWLILNDPDFIHIRTKAEIEAERQRKADRGNTALTVPVRLRDGDNCRYCRVQVMWTGSPSNRSAEFDHRHPGQPATVSTYVVACRSCNGARQDNPEWDQHHPLLPEPTNPNYGDVTARFLSKNGHPTRPNIQPDEKRARSTDTAADQARPEARPALGEQDAPVVDTAATGATDEQRPAPMWAELEDPEQDTTPQAEHPPELSENTVTCSAETGSAGSGRDAGRGGKRKRRRGKRGQGGSPPLAGHCCTAPHIQPDPETGVLICLTCETTRGAT